MSNGLPVKLAKKFAEDREAKKAPSGRELAESEATRKRAVAKARKVKQSSVRK